MENKLGVPRALAPLTDRCIVGCKDPVDLRRECMLWPDGRVAHLSCYNRARLVNGRASSQRTLPLGGLA
jgi:hypothetical protein